MRASEFVKYQNNQSNLNEATLDPRLALVLDDVDYEKFDRIEEWLKDNLDFVAEVTHNYFPNDNGLLIWFESELDLKRFQNFWGGMEKKKAEKARKDYQMWWKNI